MLRWPVALNRKVIRLLIYGGNKYVACGEAEFAKNNYVISVGVRVPQRIVATIDVLIESIRWVKHPVIGQVD